MREFLLRRPIIIYAVIAVVAVTAGVVAWRHFSSPERTVTIHLTRAVGVFPGSDVRILGVKVGEVTSVEPHGDQVELVLEYDADYPVPADATAILVPPSVVGDRYVQLAPAYTGGEELPDGAVLDTSRTVVPLELDEVYAALGEFADALGPEGVGESGELQDLLDAARENLEGNGEDFGQSLDSLGKALETVSDGRGDLFATIENLAEFTTALAESDEQVRLFNENLADVSEQLSAERDDLAEALQKLAGALVVVTGFIEDNKEALVTNVNDLAELTGTLARQQEALIAALDYAPVALSDLQLAYNSTSGTLDTRNDLLGANDPASFVCSLIAGLIPAAEVPVECVDLAQALAEAGKELPADLAALLEEVGGQ